MAPRDTPFTREPLSLAEFEARRQPSGLFESYCRARIRHWALRLTMPALLVLVFLLDQSEGSAFLSAFAILLFDTLDVLLLRHLVRKPPAPDRLPLAQGFATLTAAIHGLSVATATGILLSIGPELRFLAVTICIGMILDSALQFERNLTASFARVICQVLLLLGIYLMAWGDGSPQVQVGLVGDTVAGALMLLFGMSFIGTVHSQRKRSQWMQRATLQQANALSDMNRTLTEARQKTRRLAHVVEQTQDGVVVLDKQGQITWSNAAFADMMGRAPGQEADLNTLFARMLGVARKDRERISRSIRERRPLRADLLRTPQSGVATWLDLSLSPMRGDWQSGDAFIAVMRDISQHKKRETALAEARQAAEAAARAKTTFLATMSHEIRTPMNGVIATADLLRDSPLDPDQRALVETISSSGEALLTIINDILDFSKLDAGKLETARQPFRLGQAIRATVDLVTPLAEAKGLFLRMTSAKTLPEHVLGDEARLRQVLLNLIGNAIKFTEQGGVRIDVGCDVAGGACALRIDITDTGIGIAEDRQAEIFNTFTQADTSISRRFGGTGLGLAISRSLVRAMGGDITLMSRLGDGARFTIALDLPVMRAAPPAQTAPRQTAPPETDATPALHDHRILVAEDNRTNRMLLEKLLRPTGAGLSFAVDGAEALRQFEEVRPDLVLMDMSMPVMDGLEATRSIRALERQRGWPPCTILALTANAFEDDRQRCLDAGMDGHMSKPLRKATLLARLAAHVAARPAPAVPAQDRGDPQGPVSEPQPTMRGTGT